MVRGIAGDLCGEGLGPVQDMMKEAFAKRAEENKRATRERQTASRQSSRLDDFVLESQREINKKHPKNIRVAIN